MKLLPNADQAKVPLEKLRDYSLNPHHPTGKHKARVFEAALGLTLANAPCLRSMIRQAVSVNEARMTGESVHGTRYAVDFPALGRRGSVSIRTAWIIDAGEIIPRLTSCYIVK